MENTRIKLSETVMVIDAAYLNFVINDLKKYFEPLLGRSLQRADLALFTMCLAMDAGVKEGSNDVQILWCMMSSPGSWKIVCRPI